MIAAEIVIAIPGALAAVAAAVLLGVVIGMWAMALVMANSPGRNND